MTPQTNIAINSLLLAAWLIELRSLNQDLLTQEVATRFRQQLEKMLNALDK